MTDPTSAKQVLRREMRAIRRVIDEADGQARSTEIARRVIEILSDRAPTTVLLYDAIIGEPDLASVTAWCEWSGVAIVVPASTPDATPPVSPELLDAIVMPGLAFTRAGDRLGQGGGWFDRFVAHRHADCVLIGVCFDEQLVPSIPVADHDIAVDVVVTDRRSIRRSVENR